MSFLARGGLLGPGAVAFGMLQGPVVVDTIFNPLAVICVALAIAPCTSTAMVARPAAATVRVAPDMVQAPLISDVWVTVKCEAFIPFLVLGTKVLVSPEVAAELACAVASARVLPSPSAQVRAMAPEQASVQIRTPVYEATASIVAPLQLETRVDKRGNC